MKLVLLRVFGCGFLLLPFYLTVNDDVKDGQLIRIYVSKTQLLFAALLYMIVSGLLLFLHEHIFGVLAYYLDTQHRPLDGAFIASLIGDQGPDELLQKGKARLRRVPWQNITLDVLKSNQSTNTDVPMPLERNVGLL